jgi:hypothetical protein
VKLSYLIRGLPGHPLHPPLTDATIGAYTAATVMGTGLADWWTISPGTPLKRTVNTHLVAMVTATIFFLIAALIGHKGYTHGACRRVHTS